MRWSAGRILRPITEPVARLSSYPRGLLVLHEENVKLGQKLGASSRYLYAIHPKTMEHLGRLWRERGKVEINDLELGDNTSVPLTGSDTIGVRLDYPDKRVYYLHSLANSAVRGTNATCAQVAVGADAAMTTLLAERLSPRIYFASDLYGTVYRDVVFGGLHVEHFVFEGGGRPGVGAAGAGDAAGVHARPGVRGGLGRGAAFQRRTSVWQKAGAVISKRAVWTV